MIHSPDPSRADDRDGQEAAGCPPPVASATIVPLRGRPSYLDACREQGVFQEREEMRAELFEARGELAALEAAKSRRQGDARKLALVCQEVAPMTREEELAAREAAVVERFKAICENYQAAGLGDAYYPLLMAVLFEAPIAADQTTGLFEAAQNNGRPMSSPATDADDQPRLNGAGLGIGFKGERIR